MTDSGNLSPKIVFFKAKEEWIGVNISDVEAGLFNQANQKLNQDIGIELIDFQINYISDSDRKIIK